MNATVALNYTRSAGKRVEQGPKSLSGSFLIPALSGSQAKTSGFAEGCLLLLPISCKKFPFLLLSFRYL